MSTPAILSSFFSDEATKYFRESVAADPAFGENANLIEQDLHFDVDEDVFDFNATQDLIVDWLDKVSEYSDKGQETRRSQFPKISDNGTFPKSTRIMIGAVGLLVKPLPPEQMPTITDGDVQTADLYTLQALQQALDFSVLKIGNNTTPKLVVSGHNLVSYGSSRTLHAIYGAADAAFLAGQLATVDRSAFRIRPIEFGADEQMTISLHCPLRAALPNDSAFRVRLWMRALVAVTNG